MRLKTGSDTAPNQQAYFTTLATRHEYFNLLKLKTLNGDNSYPLTAYSGV